MLNLMLITIFMVRLHELQTAVFIVRRCVMCMTGYMKRLHNLRLYKVRRLHKVRLYKVRLHKVRLYTAVIVARLLIMTLVLIISIPLVLLHLMHITMRIMMTIAVVMLEWGNLFLNW